MDLFTLMGKVVIDCQEAGEKLDAMIEKANTLNSALGGKTTVNTSSTSTSDTGTTSTGSTGSSTPPSASGTTPQDIGWYTALGNTVSKVVEKVGGWAFDYTKEYIGTGINYIRTREQNQAALKSIYGLTDEGTAALWEELEGIAVNTMLNMDSLGDAAVKFANVGYSQERLLESVMVLSDASLGNNSRFTRLVKATSDVESYLKLRAQERNQYAEADVPIIKLLAEYYGMEGGVQEHANELADMQKDGLISSADVWGAILKATEPGGQYYEASENMLNTLAGQEERVSELKEIAAGKFAEKSGIERLYRWWLGMRGEMHESDIDFLNDPTSTPEMQKVMDIVDAITSPTLTPGDYLNQQNYSRYEPGFIGPVLPEGWTPASSVQNTEAMVTSIKSAIEEIMPGAVASGFQNTNINVNVTTSDVRLDTGALVGRILPQINVGLGVLSAFQGRGGS